MAWPGEALSEKGVQRIHEEDRYGIDHATKHGGSRSRVVQLGRRTGKCGSAGRRRNKRKNKSLPGTEERDVHGSEEPRPDSGISGWRGGRSPQRAEIIGMGPEGARNEELHRRSYSGGR